MLVCLHPSEVPDYLSGLTVDPGSVLFDRELAPRWDKVGIPEPLDYGWIGEDAEGVWVAIHPTRALLEHEDLWGVWADYQAGHTHLTLDEARQLTMWELECRQVLAAARARQETRERTRGQTVS